MEDNSTDVVSIRYTSNCNKKNSKRRKKCNNIPLGTAVEFTANITLKKCEKQTVKISPVGIEDTLVIDIEPICDCECATEGSEGFDFTSEFCDFHGNLVCGHCQCFDKPDTGDRYFGDKCQCSGNHTNPDDPESTCRAESGDALCNGRGSCECGRCVCDQPDDMEIYGEFCQCDNVSCPRFNDTVCGGHGSCVCGRCECAPGWMGDSCSCRDSPEQCVPPHLLTNHDSPPADLCSGHGRCECGECVCEDGWIGAHCDSCPTCGDICDHLKQCVQC